VALFPEEVVALEDMLCCSSISIRLIVYFFDHSWPVGVFNVCAYIVDIDVDSGRSIKQCPIT
jgi:hypothetical protein